MYRCPVRAMRHHVNQPRALRRATENDAGETRREPLARIALDCAACGPGGPSTSAALARACQRGARVSCGVGPQCCVVRSGHAAARATAAWRRQQRSGMEAGDSGQHASWRRWTRVQGRSEPSCTWNFRVPLEAGFLLRVSCAAEPWPPGHLGTTAHRGHNGIASTAHGPLRSPCGLTFDPGVRRLNSGKSSTYG